VDWEPRYFLPLHALTYLALGSALRWAALALPRAWAPGTALAMGLLLAAGLAASNPPGRGPDALRAFAALGSGAAEWLRADAPPGSAAIAHYRLNSWLRFRSGGALAVWPMPTERPLAAGELVRRARQGHRWLYI